MKKAFSSGVLILTGLLLYSQQADSLLIKQIGTMSLEDMMQMKVVSASKVEIAHVDAPASIYIVSAKEIRERGYQNLDDALKDLPGVDLINVHGVYPYVRTLRGAYGDENKRLLLLIDGQVNNSIVGSFEMGGVAYSLHNIERIELVLGAVSNTYGANAYGGVINLISKEAAIDQGAVLSQSYGSNQTKITEFAIRDRYKNTCLNFSTNLVNSDGPKFTNRHPQFTDAYIDDTYSILGRIHHKWKKACIKLGVNYFNTNTGDGTFGNVPSIKLGVPLMGNMNTGERGFINMDIDNAPGSKWHFTNFTSFAHLKMEIDKKLSFDLNLSARQTQLEDDSYSYLYNPTLDNFRKNTLTHDSYQYSGKLDLSYKISEKQNLSAGLSITTNDMEKAYRARIEDPETKVIDGFSITNINSRFKDRDNTIQHEQAFWGEYYHELDFFYKTNLYLGMRYDNNDFYGNYWAPRFNIVTNITKAFSLNLSYGTAFRAPTNFEIYGDGVVRIDNPDLEPETIKNHEFRIHYHEKNFSIELNSFYSLLDDIIIADIPVGNGYGQYQNLGSAKIYGMEGLLQVHFNKYIHFHANASILEAKEDNNNKEYDIPNIASFKANSGISFRHSELGNLHLSANYVGDRSVPETNPLGKVGSYFLMNCTYTSKRFFDNRFGFQFGLRNVFDTKYFDPGIRSADGKGNFGTVHDQMGRNGFLKLSIFLEKD